MHENMPIHRAVRWTSVPLLLTCALLAACASGPQRSTRGELRLDTETAARLRHAALLGKGASTLGAAATQAMASNLAGLVPALLLVLGSDYFRQAQFIETVSRQEEARLIAQGCTRELWRTIKPDIVLHADNDLLRSVLTLDLKFPCPDTNQPRWREYGENSAYADSNQRQIYKEALKGEALMLSPRTGVMR